MVSADSHATDDDDDDDKEDEERKRWSDDPGPDAIRDISEYL